MKNVLAALLILCAASAIAAPPTQITDYFTNAVIVSATNKNSGQTGLATGTVYVAISVAEIAAQGYSVTQITNTAQAFVYSVPSYMGDRIDAQVSTNQFTDFDIDETANYNATGSSGTRDANIVIRDQQTISVSVSE